MWRFYFSLVFLSLSLNACASKQASKPEAGPAPVDLVKSPAELRVEGETLPVKSNKVFFASLRVLTDVTGDCPEALKQQDSRLEDFLVSEPLVAESRVPKDFKSASLFNVQLKAIGFDEKSFRFSSWPSRSATPTPYGLQLRWRGSSRVEIEFLDQVELVQLDVTPVLSFQAKEVRDGCALTHQVNVWSDAKSLLPLETR
jgi:hypothetical protein